MIKKADLPAKTCLACGLPFSWRRKWAANWNDVKFCSERCRRVKLVKRENGLGCAIRPLPGKLHLVERLIQETPEIVDCDRITGEYAFLARRVVRSVEEIDAVL